MFSEEENEYRPSIKKKIIKTNVKYIVGYVTVSEGSGGVSMPQVCDWFKGQRFWSIKLIIMKVNL